MTIQERLARAKAGDVVKPTSVLSSPAPKNNLSVTERLNIAKQAELPTAPVVPKQAKPGALERIWLAGKSGASGGIAGTVGALQTAGQWLGSKASDLFGTEKALQDPEKLALVEKMAQSGAFGQQPKGEAVLNPDKLRQQSGQDLARATEGASGVGKFALEGVSSVANMGTAKATSAVTGIPFSAAMGLQAGGSAALSAKEQGKTLDQQALYGGATGLAVGLISALGGIGASKKLTPAKAKVATALLSRLPEGVLRWASTTGAKTFWRILGSGFSEALEEGIEYNTDRWLQKLILDEEVPLDIKEMSYQSLLSGTIGLLFSAANVGTNALRNRIGNAKQAQTIGAETQTAPNVPTTQPQSTQNDAIAQTDIPMPQEQLSQQRATESVREPIANGGAQVYNIFDNNLKGDMLDAKPVGLQDTRGIDRGRISSEASQGVAGNGNTGGRDNVRPVVYVEPAVRKILDESNKPNLGLKSSSENQTAFSAALKDAIETNKRGAYVSYHTPEELQSSNASTFLSDDGMAGVAVWPDGNIGAVFNNEKSPVRHASHDLILTALSNGGNKLDNFDGTLSRIYEQFGFIPVAKVKFDPQYAPDGWKPEFGSPDVIFWMHNGDSPETVARKYKQYPTNDTSALRTFDSYDEAYAYRDSVLKQQATKPLPEGLGAMKSKFPHQQKVSEFYTNTLSETDTISDEARAQLDEKDFGFVSVSKAESVEKAQQRLQVDFGGEVEHLSQADTYVAAEDVDTAMGILASYSAEATESGDATKLKNWAVNMYEKIHQSAVALQALDKYSRTPEGAVLKAQQEVSKAERSLTTTEVNGKRVKNKRGRDIADDTETVKTIVDEISKGKTLEDVKEKSKRLKKVKLQDIVDLVASGKYTDEAITDMVKAKYGIPTLSADDFRNIYEYAQLANETTDDYQKRAYLYKAGEIIANRMTSTFREKVLMTRRLAMLLNPKTVISRNAGGNLIFGAAETIKDAPGTLIDYLVSKKTGKRTTSLNLYETAKSQAKGAKRAVTEMAKDVKLGVDTSPTRHELPSAKVLESKLGRGAEKLLNVLMQFGDRPFFEGAYEARMNELQRLGYDTNSEDVQSHVFNYALERVFQNDSELSKRASRIRKSLGLLGDIKMPFVQTPTNIFDKLLDYSPYGYARAIKQAGSISNSPWSQKQFVDTLARAFTGTGVLLLGYFGFLKGLLTGSKDDKNEKVIGAEQRAGSQEYSVVVDGKSYTYDWASPIGALLAMGANMAQAGVNQEGMVGMLTATTKAGIDVMFEQSYLQGLSELFGKENFSEGLQSVLMGLPASFIPTGFQQIARIIDNTQRDTFDKDPVMRMLKRMAVKIPFASKMLPPKIDPTGEEAKQFQGRSTASNAFESFISPGYIGENVQNAVDKELYDLYSRTGDTDVLPRWSAYTSKADLKFSVGGKEYEMTDKEWIQYQKTLGKATYSEVDKLIKSPDYRKASVADKSEMIKDIISEATEKAKREIVEARGDMFLNKAGRERVKEYNKAGLNDKQAYELYKKIQALEPKDGKKTVSQEQKLDVILSSNYSAKTKAGLVATLYDNSLLHKLDSHSTLLNIYKSTKDTSYINMTVPDKFSENKTEYVLTDSEKALYEKTFVEFMNKHGKPAPIGSLQAEQARMKKLIGIAKDRARLEVVKNRR